MKKIIIATIFSLFLSFIIGGISASAAKKNSGGDYDSICICQGNYYCVNKKWTRCRKAKWKTDNRKVAVVSGKGRIYAIKKGTAFITCTYKTKGKTKRFSFFIRVVPKSCLY